MLRLLKQLALAAGMLWGAGTAGAADDRASAMEVTAAVVYNLLQFIDWPDGPRSANGSFGLCLLEGGALEAALKKHEGRKVHGLTLSLRRVTGAADELAQCRAVMVEAGNPAAMARLAVAAKSQPLLVVGEGARAVSNGAMVGIDTDGGRIVFDIELGSLRRSRLVASSRLLRLARQVIE